MNNEHPPLRTAILISGGGTNLQAIIDQTVAGNLNIEIAEVLSDRPDAFGLERAQKAGIPTTTVDYENFSGREEFSIALQTELTRINPDLIVLDIMMPKLDGYESCKALKSDPETLDIPVILLSAKGRNVDQKVGFEVGADDYITKPFSPRKLVERINSILGQTSRQDVALA